LRNPLFNSRFIAQGENGLGTPHLYGNLADRWLTPRLVKMGLDEEGMGWHSFKRFRKTWLLHVWPSMPIREAREAMNEILTFVQIGDLQERPQTVGGEGNPPDPAPTKISGMRSARDDAQVKGLDYSPAVVSRP
jgi:hypothetical protein